MIALGNILGNNAVSIIFDFLEDSSVAGTCDTDIIANEGALKPLDEIRIYSADILYRGSMEYPALRRPCCARRR